MNKDDLESQLNRLRLKWKFLRYRAGFTSTRQADKALGVHYGTVSRLESARAGSDPQAGTLIKLARVYGVPAWEMLSEDLPAKPFDHLGEGWSEWIMENLDAVRHIWDMVGREKFPEMYDDGGIKPIFEPGRMGILLWAANPAHLDKLKEARAWQEFNKRKGRT